MMKQKLLVAVASVTLAAASGALAQQENRVPAERSAPPTVGSPNSGAQHQNQSPGAQQNREERGRAAQPGRGETTGQAPQDRPGPGGVDRSNRSDRERPAAQQNEQQNRAGQNERKKGEDNREDRSRSTTGQGTPQSQPGERRNDNVQINRDRENVDRDRTTNDRDRTQGGRGERNENRTVNEGRGSSGVSVNLSQEQRTRIHEVIVKERSAPRVNSVDFALSVGTPVPRSVRLVAVPSTLIEIEPRWRGFEYFLVGDEIVIVDPRRMEIVAVIPA